MLVRQRFGCDLMLRKETGDYRMRFRLLGVMALTLLWAMPAAAQVDVDRFLRRDTYGQVKISPSGAYYAATIELPDREVLVIARRSDGKFTAKATGGPHSAVADFWWVSNQRYMWTIEPYPGREYDEQRSAPVHCD